MTDVALVPTPQHTWISGLVRKERLQDWLNQESIVHVEGIHKEGRHFRQRLRVARLERQATDTRRNRHLYALRARRWQPRSHVLRRWQPRQQLDSDGEHNIMCDLGEDLFLYISCA